MRKEIRIIIEKSTDHYSAYAENVEGIYGAGDSVEEAKNSALKSIQLLIEFNDPKTLPQILKNPHEVVFQMDVPSVLNYYKGVFTLSALERITGINQKQLQHYSTGLRKPRPAQNQKIENAFHKLGSELLALEL